MSIRLLTSIYFIHNMINVPNPLVTSATKPNSVKMADSVPFVGNIQCIQSCTYMLATAVVSRGLTYLRPYIDGVQGERSGRVEFRAHVALHHEIVV